METLLTIKVSFFKAKTKVASYSKNSCKVGDMKRIQKILMLNQFKNFRFVLSIYFRR